MEHKIQPFTGEEFKSHFDEFVAGLSKDEKKLLDQALWDEQGTSFETGLSNFFEANSDGSSQANQNIAELVKKFEEERAIAKSSGDSQREKFFEMLGKMKLPVQADSLQGTAGALQQLPNLPPKKTEHNVAEQQKAEKVDLEKQLKKFMNDLPYDQRKLLKEMKWKNTGKDWEDGFLEFIEKDVTKAGKFGVTMFKDFIVNLRREYEDTSESKDPEHKKLLKGQITVAEKMFGIFTKEKAEDKQKNKEKMKSIYGWENIKFTLRNIRRQIFELVGMKDPWWNYDQQQLGMNQLENQATGKSYSTPVAPQSTKEQTVFDEFLKKRAGNDTKAAPSDHSQDKGDRAA